MLTARRWGAALALLAAAACSGGSADATPGTTPSPTATPTPTASPVPSATAAPYVLAELGTFDNPVWAAPVPGDPLHLWLVEKTGRVVEITPAGEKVRVVLDVTRLVSRGNEQGLLSMAFDPGFAKNRRFYVDYTDKQGDTQVVRYTLVGGQPLERLVVLSLDQPHPNHNGGLILFDRSGKLLVGTGDGGSVGDPDNHAQDLRSDLGKILRLNPDGTPAAGNPYPQNPRVWALGLRQPWRFSFDTNGDFYLGDVGQRKAEEIDVVPPSLQRGANYGWSVYEGNEPFRTDGTFTPGGPLIAPALTYLHSDGGCSVTGGVVYRGKAIPDLVGHYVFGDYCIGRVMVTTRTPTGLVSPATDLGVKVAGLQAFGVDAQGELLVMSADTLYRLTV